jgi:hypothetical protein
LGEITILPVVEIDKIFWREGLQATPRTEWVKIQEQLVSRDEWILDGDLGPYDAVEVRLHRADTIILLNFSLLRCAWRAWRRGSEGADFWRWVISYRRKSRTVLMKAIDEHAAGAQVHVFRNQRDLNRFIEMCSSGQNL